MKNETTHNGRVEVKPGQVWADNDPRMTGRMLRVEALTWTKYPDEPPVVANRPPRYARCVTGWTADGAFREHNTRRRVWIRIDRFRPTSTGYRLVSAATPNSTEQG